MELVSRSSDHICFWERGENVPYPPIPHPDSWSLLDWILFIWTVRKKKKKKIKRKAPDAPDAAEDREVRLHQCPWGPVFWFSRPATKESPGPSTACPRSDLSWQDRLPRGCPHPEEVQSWLDILVAFMRPICLFHKSEWEGCHQQKAVSKLQPLRLYRFWMNYLWNSLGLAVFCVLVNFLSFLHEDGSTEIFYLLWDHFW